MESLAVVRPLLEEVCSASGRACARLTSQQHAMTLRSCCKAGCVFLRTRHSPVQIHLRGHIFPAAFALPPRHDGFANGFGMLLMYLIMPTIVRLVYPSPLGKIHTIFLGIYRNCFIAEEGHSRSIRIDLMHSIDDGSNRLAVDAAVELENPVSGGDARDIEAARLARLRPYAVHTVACLADNYAYVIVDLARSGMGPIEVALVDPCEPSAALKALQNLSREEYDGRALEPVAILTTHRHWDHAGGNKTLKKHFPRIRIYGGVEDHVSCCTHPLRDGDALSVGSLTIVALHAPCHTRGSLCFRIDGPTPTLFGGDTLFCGGCGAPFEGTAAEMSHNFAKIWKRCPPNTLIFTGHEYTVSILPSYFNGQLPLPNHPAAFGKVCSLLWRAQQLRSHSSPVPTSPLILADELLINSNFSALRTAAETLSSVYRQYKAFMAHSAALEANGATIEEEDDEDEDAMPNAAGQGEQHGRVARRIETGEMELDLVGGPGGGGGGGGSGGNGPLQAPPLSGPPSCSASPRASTGAHILLVTQTAYLTAPHKRHIVTAAITATGFRGH